MKLCRFLYGGKGCCGVIRGNMIYPLKERKLFGSITVYGDGIKACEAEFLCPTEPVNIFAIGLNYRKHAEEMEMQLPKEPLMFLKAVSSLAKHNSDIIRPPQTNELSCEAELAIVVKKQCKNVKTENAQEYILGYSMINDVTARDIQRGESQWARAKSFDTFCPYGPVIETETDRVGPGIRLYADGRILQDGRLDNMIFPPEYILSYVSHQCTLNAGDIIATGTPMGVTTIYPGERVAVEIDNLGRLENTVVTGDE